MLSDYALDAVMDRDDLVLPIAGGEQESDEAFVARMRLWVEEQQSLELAGEDEQWTAIARLCDLAERASDLDRRKLKAAEQNHIWLNAFACIRPTDELKLDLANTILGWLNQRDRLLPADEGRLGELTPSLYLSVNKS